MMRKTILLVEDNADDEALMIRALQRVAIHADLVVVRDGDEALHYLQSASGRALPSLVLTDLKLPRISGFELLRRIRSDAATRSLTVIVLSSSMEDVDVRRAYELGADGYVRKPVDFHRFHDLVRKLASYWLGLAPGSPAPSSMNP
jgi:two-component system response regulator